MKKFFLYLGISLLFLSSCTDDEQFASIEEAQKIIMTVEDFKFDSHSRTVLTPTDDGATFTWSVNDTVGIFPESGSQVAFPMASGAGTNSATFTGGGWALKTSTPYMAYYPMVGKFYLDKENIFVNYTGQSVAENASTAHLGKFDYMVASATTPSFGTVNFQFKHLGALVRLKVKMKEASVLRYVTLNSDENDFTKMGYIDLTEENPSVSTINASDKSSSFQIGLNNISVAAEEDLIVYFLMPPVDLTGKTLKAVIFKNNGYYQEVVLTGTNFEAGSTYELTATMESEEENPSIINVQDAGSLEPSIKVQYPYPYQLTSLKITGNLNGTDIRYLRKLAGRKEDGTTTNGKLTYLDLTDANIVTGGEYYIKYNNTEYLTENNIAGDYMFFQCNLKTIKFPLTVTKLGKEICSHLYSSDNHKGTFTSITIPLGVTVIGDNAFAWNQNLASIEIPNTVKEIGGNIIYRCEALTTINIPNSVEKMSCAFFFATGLQYIHLPENSKYTKIESSTFYGCEALKSLTIPVNITTIDWYAIQNSALEEFHFKSNTPPYMSTTMSGQYDFPKNCKIYVPQGCYNTYKTNDAFKNCNIIEE